MNPPWGDVPYDRKTPAEVVDDYVLTRGDLSEPETRQQFALWIARYGEHQAALAGRDERRRISRKVEHEWVDHFTRGDTTPREIFVRVQEIIRGFNVDPAADPETPPFCEHGYFEAHQTPILVHDEPGKVRHGGWADCPGPDDETRAIARVMGEHPEPDWHSDRVTCLGNACEWEYVYERPSESRDMWGLWRDHVVHAVVERLAKVRR